MLYRLNDLQHGIIRRRYQVYTPVPEVLLNSHPVASFRSRVGLPKNLSHRPSTVCMWPDWFAAPQPDWPSDMMIAGFPFYPRPDSSTGTGSSHVAGRPDSRPIVFTTGSIASSQTDFFTAVVEACRVLKRPAILVSPHGGHIPRNLPDYVDYASFVPFSELFARASLVVHHGGIGTASYAISAGIPQIIMPMRGDQFDNGNGLVRLGVARMLAPRQTSGARLARSIEFILNSDFVASRCGLWQSKIDSEAGLNIAASYIEDLAEASRNRTCNTLVYLGIRD